MRRGWAVLALWLGAAVAADLGALSCYGILRSALSPPGTVGDQGDIFGAEAVMVLPQAGQYVGPDAINEYLAVMQAGALFVNRSFAPASRARFEEWDAEAGICKFRNIGIYATELKLGGVRLTMVQMQRVSYRPSDGKIAEVRVYFPPAALGLPGGGGAAGLLFAVGGLPEARELTCGVLQSHCNDTWARNGLTSIGECVERLGALPATEGPAHHIDGNSSGCRALHASMARTNPLHCPHISLDPELDANGKLKCHQGGKYTAGKGFSQDDMNAFVAFAGSQGIPEEGFKYLSEEEFAMVASQKPRTMIEWDSLPGLGGLIGLVSVVLLTVAVVVMFAPSNSTEAAAPDMEPMVKQSLGAMIGVGTDQISSVGGRRSSSLVPELEMRLGAQQAPAVLSALSAAGSGQTLVTMLTAQLLASGHSGPMPVAVTVTLLDVRMAEDGAESSSGLSVALIVTVAAVLLLVVALVVVFGALVYMYRRAAQAAPEAELEPQLAVGSPREAISVDVIHVANPIRTSVLPTASGQAQS